MRFDPSIIAANWSFFADGLRVTLIFCAAGTAGGLMFAVPVALGRLSKNPWSRVPASVFVEVVRDTPFLVQVFIIFFVLPGVGVFITSTTAGILALSIHSAAYFAESIRGAVLSVPRGQMDAARASGMSYLLAMRRIVYPQMAAYLIPPLTNQLIGTIKDSSVLSVITVPELTMATQNVVGKTFAPVEAYAMVAILYWMLTSAVAGIMSSLERRTATYRSNRPMPALVLAEDK